MTWGIPFIFLLIILCYDSRKNKNKVTLHHVLTAQIEKPGSKRNIEGVQHLKK